MVPRNRGGPLRTWPLLIVILRVSSTHFLQRVRVFSNIFVIFRHFFALHSTLQIMDFVRLSALENRMGELKVRPLQFGENNSTHFRTRPSTKEEKM